MVSINNKVGFYELKGQLQPVPPLEVLMGDYIRTLSIYKPQALANYVRETSCRNFGPNTITFTSRFHATKSVLEQQRAKLVTRLIAEGLNAEEGLRRIVTYEVRTYNQRILTIPEMEKIRQEFGLAG